TFGGTPLVLAEYGLAGRAIEINRAAAALARAEADAFSTADKPRFVAGSMGPTTKAISVTGGVTFEQLIEHYETQARGLHAGGVDYLLLETAQDTRNVKAGLIGIDRFQSQLAPEERLPSALTARFGRWGRMLEGKRVAARRFSLRP